MDEVITQEEIIEITQNVIDLFVIPDFESRGHNASGEWLRSLRAEARGNSGVIIGKNYTEYLVTGSKPQQKSDEDIRKWVGWAGKYIFDQWVQNKGLNLNPYAVAHKIAKEGSKIYREGGSDFLRILESDEVINYVISQLRDKISVKVVNILRNDLLKLKHA